MHRMLRYKPETRKDNKSGEGYKLLYGVSSMQGWRREMEDAYCASTNFGIDNEEYPGLEDWSFFAVFDGHCGNQASHYCSINLLNFIQYSKEFKNGHYKEGIIRGFLDIDKIMRTEPCIMFDEDSISGSTVVCVFISPNDITIANCGDSRAVLCSEGTPFFATEDHKPVLPDEAKRIHNAGGKVLLRRVNGTLGVSRALGDFKYKRARNKGPCEQLVSPEPELFCFSRKEIDEFLVLASDGVWDVINNEEICSFIISRMKITNDLVAIANQVVDTCMNKGSRDNISIIIIAFPAAPTPTEEAIEADKRLDEEIEKTTRELMESTEFESFSDLLEALKDKNIEDLPPGGGLHSKCHLIQAIYDELSVRPRNKPADWIEEILDEFKKYEEQ